MPSNKTLLATAALGLAVAFSAAVATTAGARPSDRASMEYRSSRPESRAYLHSYNLPGDGVALQGYSPVSYFDGRAERGSALFAVEHEGVTYHLADARQVAAFRGNPERYVPAFGGWCAFGMSVQDKFPVDPTNFKIVDGQLMLFLRNPAIDALELWNQGEESTLMRKARAHWKKVRG